MQRKKTPASKQVPKRQTSTRSWLEEQSKKELIEFILEVALEHPRISELLSDRANLKQAKTGPIREAIRRDIDALEPDWQVVSEALEKRLEAQPMPHILWSL